MHFGCSVVSGFWTRSWRYVGSSYSNDLTKRFHHLDPHEVRICGYPRKRLLFRLEKSINNQCISLLCSLSAPARRTAIYNSRAAVDGYTFNIRKNNLAAVGDLFRVHSAMAGSKPSSIVRADFGL